MAIDTALYTAQATSTGGRSGTTKSSDGRVSLNLSTPKGLGGDDGPGTNPEQLFAAGYSACFGSAVAHVAQLQKIDVGEVKVVADVNLNQGDDGFSISVALNVTLLIDRPKSVNPT